MDEDYIKIKIENKNYNSISDIDIYVTKKLKEELESIKVKDGTNLFEILKNRGFRGGKHLLETLREKIGKNLTVILSHGKTELKENKVTINFNDYRKIGSKAFFDVYRKTGLDTANTFLREKIPSIASSIAETLTKKEAEKAIDILPETTKKISIKKKNKLFENITHLIKESHIDKNKINIGTLKQLKAAANQAYYKNKIDEFNKRLSKRYSETKGKDSWQNWIYSNSWIFGSQYMYPIQKQKVGFDQIPDFVFLTVDGFLDILEIKVPDKEIIREDKNHNGSFYWSPDVSQAIGQVANYLHEIEKNQLIVAENIKKNLKIEISTIKPRANILVGRTTDWNSEKLKALRKLNFALHGIEIVSYDQILKRAERLTEIFDVDNKK